MPNYSDKLLKEIHENTLKSLQQAEDGTPYEDALQCILLLVEDLQTARKALKDEKNAS